MVQSEQAAAIRKRLHQYCNGEGREEEPRIEPAAGSYVSAFHLMEAAKAPGARHVRRAMAGSPYTQPVARGCDLDAASLADLSGKVEENEV